MEEAHFPLTLSNHLRFDTPMPEKIFYNILQLLESDWEIYLEKKFSK